MAMFCFRVFFFWVAVVEKQKSIFLGRTLGWFVLGL